MNQNLFVFQSLCNMNLNSTFPLLRVVILAGLGAGMLSVWSCESAGSGREEADRTKNDTLPLTEIEFKETIYHFGKVKQGDPVEHKFEFKNVGKKPLKIYRASASCGCTKPRYPEGMIMPGDKGVVTVQFNTSGREGEQKKKATVVVNTEQKYYDLKIQGEVVESKDKNGGKKKKSSEDAAPADSSH